MAKGKRQPLRKTTLCRSERPLQRVFVDLSGPKPTQSVGGASYIMLIKDDFSRFGWTYFMKNKSDAGATFKRFLTDIRDSTKPSVVECVRSDGGGEFSGGAFRELCEERGIRQEFTTPDTPQLNGVVERGLAIVQEAAQAACLEAPRLFPDVQTPATASLWAEACFWANDALNRSATEANPGRASPWSRFYGEAPPLSMLPFLKPGYCRVRRDSKAAPKAEICFYLNGGSNHPSSSFKVKLPSGAVVYTRDVTWAHPREPFTLPEPAGGGGFVNIYPPEPASTPPPLPQQQQPPSPTPSTLPQQQQQPQPPTPSPASSPASSPPLSPYRVTRQLGNHLSGPGDGDERQPGRTRAQSRAHRRGLLSMLTNQNDMAQAFVEQRPPSQPLAKLPTCPASELSAPTSFADANASEFRDTWHEAMAKEYIGLCDAGTFGEA